MGMAQMAASGVTMAQLEQQKVQQAQQVAPQVDSSTSNFLGFGGSAASLVNLGGMTTPPGVKAATVSPALHTFDHFASFRMHAVHVAVARPLNIGVVLCALVCFGEQGQGNWAAGAPAPMGGAPKPQASMSSLLGDGLGGRTAAAPAPKAGMSMGMMQQQPMGMMGAPMQQQQPMMQQQQQVYPQPLPRTMLHKCPSIGYVDPSCSPPPDVA